MLKSTERFTHTVQDYIKSRPSYPKEVLQVLIDECGLTQSTIIADVGSGTGILAKLFLDYGNTVYGVEPNQAMRFAGEDFLKDYSNFKSIDGSAEATTLEKRSVDIITVGTAFHWFEVEKTKLEFQRILKPHGYVLVVWNVRDIEKSAVVKEYENLILKYNADYRQSGARHFDKGQLKKFFLAGQMHECSFVNKQQFDFEGLKGRLLSTSYSLQSDDERYATMLNELQQIFERHQKNGAVEFLYSTKLYYGQLGN